MHYLNNPIFIIFFLSISIYSNSISNDNRVQEPTLISSLVVQYPLSIIKKGIDGNVILDIHIHEDGSVKMVDVVNNIHPILDSLAKYSASQFKFTPAKLNGEAIPVIIRYEYIFDSNEILTTTQCEPNFIGTLLDADTREPLRNFNILCSFTDTTLDTALSIPFYSYIKSIANHNNQSFVENNLITTTDSSGKFYFYLLPTCSLEIIINPVEYKRYEVDEAILPNTITSSIYPISLLNNTENENYDITVYGKESHYEVMNVQRAELKYGLKDDINKIISMRSEVNFIPGKKSTILVNGGGPYDNRYEINDIPIFSPSHFSTIPKVDVSGIMLSTIKDVSILSSNICGRYSQAPGCVVKMRSEINRPIVNNLKKRPETSVNMSIRHMDFNVYAPPINKKDYYKIGYRLVHNFLIKSFGINSENSLNGLSLPANYQDITFTGNTNFKHFEIQSFFWASLDRYEISNFNRRKYIPWGLGSVTLLPQEKSNVFRMVLGGSSQNYFEGKRMGFSAPLKNVERKNATVLFAFDSIPVGIFTLTFKERIELIKWNNKLTKRYYIDSTLPVEDLKVKNKRNEIFIESHVGIKYSIQDIASCGVNILAGSEVKSKNYFIDPGVWIHVGNNKNYYGFFGGITSSQPDMRGFPQADYRKEITKTYMTSALLKRNFRNIIYLSLESYYRKRNHCPMISYDYTMPVWDKDLATPLYSLGNNYSIDIKSKYCTITIAGMIGKSYRKSNNQKQPYEWDIPWVLKSTIHFNLKNDWMHIFLTNMIAAGIPYRNIITGELKRTDRYFRPDISFEYHTKEIKHRYLTRFDIYIGMINIINRDNFGEVFWLNDQIYPREIKIIPRYMYLGGRFYFRH